jgi:hypothetical protein
VEVRLWHEFARYVSISETMLFKAAILSKVAAFLASGKKDSDRGGPIGF